MKSSDGFYNPPSFNSLSNSNDALLNAFKMKNSQNNGFPFNNGMPNSFGVGVGQMNTGLPNQQPSPNQFYNQPVLPNVNGFNPNFGVLPPANADANQINSFQGIQNMNTNLNSPNSYNFKQKESAAPLNNQNVYSF